MSEGFEKRGVVTATSKGDHDFSKKAEYADTESPYITDREHKHLLKKPIKLDNGLTKRTF